MALTAPNGPLAFATPPLYITYWTEVDTEAPGMTDSPELLSKISQPSVLHPLPHPDAGTVGVVLTDVFSLRQTGFLSPPLTLQTHTASTTVRQPHPASLQEQRPGSVMPFHPPRYLGVGMHLPSPQIWVRLMSKRLWASRSLAIGQAAKGQTGWPPTSHPAEGTSPALITSMRRLK